MVTRPKADVFKPKYPFQHSTSLSKTSISEPYLHSEVRTYLFLASQYLSVWRLATSDENNALLSQHTWDLVSLPLHKSVIGCKRVFKLKHNADGSVAIYKVRLVAKDFNQIEGLDYFETFSPVFKQSTIRLVLSLALHFGWNVTQLDVSNAFLHGLLEEGVYMVQPPSFLDSSLPNHVCKLNKALYELKQVPRAWFATLSIFLLQYGFSNSVADNSFFVYHHSGHITVVLVYVDDILITGSDC